MRLNYLSEKLGVKLIGRKGLGPTADSVIASIKAERANHKSSSTSLTRKSGISKPKSATSKQKLVRKAKVMRFNNESTPQKLGGGALVVGNGIGSLSSPNQNLGSKIVGNRSSSTPSVNTLVGGLHGSLSPPNLNTTNGKMAEQM
ncbi:uncharacterized protein LOC114266968 isoform X1 [Camellia sinensis]|uniref:uncharacterized protein LOC114266968 isoform X1 n=1 Tax=Camellia sinensis TaxID=4442 RepID=UPI0010360425|nr:uncharacterized protein LOC114266968 isoform X1 [Camellia sinensis]